MAEHGHNLLASASQPVQAVANQSPANAASLVRRHHGHWGQRDGRQGVVAGLEQDATEEYMADDASPVFREKRGEHGAFMAQAIHEIPFVRASKRCDMHGMDGGAVRGTLPSQPDPILGTHAAIVAVQRRGCANAAYATRR